MKTRAKTSGVRRPFDDRTLIEVSEVANIVVFIDPFAMAEETYFGCVKLPADVTGQSERLRLWKVLCAMHSAISAGTTRKEWVDRSAFKFWMDIAVDAAAACKQVHLKDYCGPGRLVILTTTRADEY